MRTPPLPIPQFSPRLSVSAVNPSLFCCSGQPFSSGRTQGPGDGWSERHRRSNGARVDGRGGGGHHHGYRWWPRRAAGWRAGGRFWQVTVVDRKSVVEGKRVDVGG